MNAEKAALGRGRFERDRLKRESCKITTVSNAKGRGTLRCFFPGRESASSLFKAILGGGGGTERNQTKTQIVIYNLLGQIKSCRQ